MKTICTGRKVNLKPSFEERVEKRLSKLDRFFDDEVEAHVTVVVEKNHQKVEITVRDGSFVARAEREAPAMEDAFEAAADVLTKNIVKNRKKLAERYQRGLTEEDFAQEVYEEADYVPIREKHFVVKPCSAEEAILQMNLLGHNFYLFRDADTDEVNAVYTRHDGSYGLLIPER